MLSCPMASKNLFVSLFLSSFLPCECFFRPHIAKIIERHDCFLLSSLARFDLLLLFAVFSMSSAISTTATPIGSLAKVFDRKKLLQMWGLPIRCPRVADVKGLRPFSTSVKSALHVHESHVPLFGKGPGEICSGAKLMRHGRITVGVTCGSTEISSESGFCLQIAKGCF